VIDVGAHVGLHTIFYAQRVRRRGRVPLILFERNAKQVTETMQSMIEIPPQIRKFRIEAYTARLGYSEPLQLGDKEYLLRPPRR
jgi:hypothetical protein